MNKLKVQSSHMLAYKKKYLDQPQQPPEHISKNFDDQPQQPPEHIPENFLDQPQQLPEHISKNFLELPQQPPENISKNFLGIRSKILENMPMSQPPDIVGHKPKQPPDPIGEDQDMLHSEPEPHKCEMLKQGKYIAVYNILRYEML